MKIEREYQPDREAMKAALRVVLGIPQPKPEPAGALTVTVDFRIGQKHGQDTFTVPINVSEDPRIAVRAAELEFFESMSRAARAASEPPAP